MATYKPLEQLTLDDLRKALAAVQEIGVSPFQLLAFAKAVDAVEESKASADEPEEDRMSAMDWLEAELDLDGTTMEETHVELVEAAIECLKKIPG